MTRQSVVLEKRVNYSD